MLSYPNCFQIIDPVLDSTGVIALVLMGEILMQ